MKKFSRYSVLFSLLFLTITSTAQVVGGRGNSQSSPQEVKASELSKGAYTADVNLFTGALSTSYTLGSVSTPSGLSYTLSMDYSSNFSGGDNAPLSKGIPYGDGWSLNLPTVSVSTEDYCKYNRFQRAQNDALSGDVSVTDFSDGGAGIEGRPYWFAPVITIPGVISERFVYKYTEKNGAMAGDLIFVPSKFDKYVEARLRTDNSWSVTIEDGTVYEFATASVNVRNASNQRYLVENHAVLDPITGNYSYPPSSPGQGVYSPRFETLDWTISRIFHPNYPNNQQILFTYQLFGGFNYFKELLDPKFIAATTFTNDFTVYKDILLMRIDAVENFGTEYIEKLVLNYKTTVPGVTSNMLLPGQVGVSRKDSLYNYKTVYATGINGTYEPMQMDSAQNTTPSNSNFDGWLRYYHSKSDFAHSHGVSSTYNMVSSNPYIYDKQGLATDGGVNSAPAQYNQYLLRSPAIVGQPNTNNLKFNHGFLESPLIGPSTSNSVYLNLPPGDIYELKTLIANSNSSPDINFCNFDMNIVTGDNTSTSESTPTSASEIDYHTYQEHRYTTVFSTFNQSVKWNTNSITGSTIKTSNFFSLPNLPYEFGGFRIQIGPSNSDHNFATFGSSGFNIKPNPSSQTPSAFKAYSNEIAKNFNSILKAEAACSAPPNNFGIGLEWHMMRDIYDRMYDLQYNEPAPRYKFWWNDNTASNLTPWPNTPTLANDKVELLAVELVRYSKNPYMLTSVKTYRINGIDTLLGRTKEVLTSMLKFDYDLVTINVLNNYEPEGLTLNYSSIPQQTNSLQKQNVFRLKCIREIPVNSANNNTALASLDTTKVPSTHFDYSQYASPYNGGFSVQPYISAAQATPQVPETDTVSGICAGGNCDTYYSLNGTHWFRIWEKLKCRTDVFALTKITDRLGGVTAYDYYNTDLYHTLRSTNYQWKPIQRELDYGEPYNTDIHMAKSFAINYILSVKTKTVADASTATYPKVWNYTYQNEGGGPLTPTDLGSHFDISITKNQVGYAKTIVAEPLIDTNPNRVRTEYTHYIGEQSGLLFGKLKLSQEFDAGNHLLEKKTYTYKTRQAYVNGRFRYPNLVNASYTYLKHWADPVGDYFDGTYTSYTSSYLPIAGYGDIGSMLFLEASTYGTHFNTPYLNSYFVSLVKESAITYDLQLPIIHVTPVIKNRMVSPVVIGSVKQLTGNLANNSISLGLQQLPWNSVSIENITEYEYWDADSVGRTSCNGNKILDGISQTSITPITLTYEPSWELYRKKTYSPQLPGAYSVEENFYFHDLRSNANVVSGSDTLSGFDALNFTAYYRLRNLPYETRTTTKSQGCDPIVKSNYYWYDARWVESETYQIDDTLNFTSPYTCDTIVNPGGGGGYVGAPCPDCFPYDIHLNPSGFYIFHTTDNGNWWCPYSCYSIPVDTTQNRSLNREKIFFHDLRDKLFLRYTAIQVDTVPMNDPAYISLDNGNKHTLRFKPTTHYSQPGNFPFTFYEPSFPFATLVNYAVEERNLYGQVKLEDDVKGLKTKYFYSPNKTILFWDPVNSCESHSVRAFFNMGLPDSVTVGYGISQALTTRYVFNKDHSVNTLTDPNGMRMQYRYDEYGRLKNTYRNEQLLAINNYHNWENDFTQTFEQRATENYVESLTVLDSGSTVAERSRSYVDPQGRKYDVLTQITPNYNSLTSYDTIMIHSGLTIFDNWNRTTKQYKPFKQTNAAGISFSPQFNPNPSTEPKTETLYENTQRSRALRASKFGQDITTGYTVNSSYSLIKGTTLASELGLSPSEKTLLMPGSANAYTFLKTSAIDEDGKKVVTYTDAIGRQIAIKTYIAFNNTAVTLFVYNSQGQQAVVINPSKQQSSYKYNLLEQLYSKTTVDAGEVKYMYNSSGQVVLEQDVNASTGTDNNGTPYLRRYRYDLFGRLVKQERYGLIDSTYRNPLYYQTFQPNSYDYPNDYRIIFSNASTMDYTFNGQTVSFPFCGPGCLDTMYTNVAVDAYLMPLATEKEFFYHTKIDSAISPSSYSVDHRILSYFRSQPQKNLKGRLSYSVSYNNINVPVNLCVYNYSAEGNLKNEIHQFFGPGLYNYIKETLIQSINYNSYNKRGSVKDITVDDKMDGSINLQMGYEYDGWNRLKKVFANNIQLATYDYIDELGLVKKVKYFQRGYLGCLRTVDSIQYTYDVRDRLDTLQSRFFDENLFYDGNLPSTGNTVYDVAATINYNGNINATKGIYKTNLATNYGTIGNSMDGATYYGYTYDEMNRLTNADASVMNVVSGVAAGSPKLKYGDETLTYDKIGNIQTLQRGLYYLPGSVALNAVTSWDYHYITGTNKLDRIDSSSTNLYNYTFDANGNLRTDDKKHLTQSFYGRSNLPSNITVNGNELTYLYNDKDNRIFKSNSINSGREYYLQNAGGQTMGIYDLMNHSWIWYGYGKDRIAKIADTNEFYINDHLGNVRVAYNYSYHCDTHAEAYIINNANDYYSYGKILRSFEGNDEKYRFTGKERDKETQLDYFEARFFDSDIGVFRQVDPHTQKYSNLSPYNYVGDNPINFLDRNGKDIYVYYVGGEWFDMFGLMGHTAAGYYGKYDPNKGVSYYPASGANGGTENRISVSDGLPYTGYSEKNTIKSYIDGGEIVQRMSYSLPDKVEEQMATLVEGYVRNQQTGDGAWCTGQVYGLIKESYEYAGFSSEEAKKQADRIVNYSTPQELSYKQMYESGATGYDKFYKNGDKYVQEKGIFTSEVKDGVKKVSLLIETTTSSDFEMKKDVEKHYVEEKIN